MKSKLKFLLVFVCTLSILISVVVVPCSASDTLQDGTLTEYNFDVPTDLVEDKYYVLYANDSGLYRLITSDTEFYLLQDGTSGTGFMISDTPIALTSNSVPTGYTANSLVAYRFDTSTNEWVTWVTNQQFKAGYFVNMLTASYTSLSECYSNFDVKLVHRYSENPTSATTDFFTQAPLMPTILHMTLGGVVYLIPYLLVFLIGLVAFWKSWQFLSRQLRMA